MINDSKFNKNEIKRSVWQYEIRHHSANNFKVGEDVFLKSNPGCVMKIHSINNNKLLCYWKDKKNELQFSEFIPECILQYKFRVLLEYMDNYKICLN